MQEKELIYRLQNKDEKAYNELISAFRKKVVHTCYNFLHNSEDARDLAQDVFIEVFESADSFKFNSSLNTWIYRITVNKCLDEIRKRNRKKRAAKIISFLGIKSLDSIVSLRDDKTPESIIVNDERSVAFHKAVDSLPERQKIVFTLCKFEDMTNKQVAEVLDTNINAVDALLHRAKTNIKKSFEKYIN